jgi:hypothetical protein
MMFSMCASELYPDKQTAVVQFRDKRVQRENESRGGDGTNDGNVRKAQQPPDG